MQAQGPAHAPADTRTPREAALEALTRWYAEKPRQRVDPRTLAIDEVRAVGPMQIVLESTFERRGVRYTHTRAPTAPDVQDQGPDPWEARLDHPTPLRVGSEVTTPLGGQPLHRDCGICSRTGEAVCRMCHGNGRLQQTEPSLRCPTCSGRGQAVCLTCGGSGGLYGTPSAWSVIDHHTELRVVEDGELPLDVFLALQNAGVPGVLVHVQEGERVDSLRRSRGYRDGSTHGPEAQLHTVVGALAAAPGVPTTDRIRRQRLEVRRMPVFEVRLRGGESLYVYGDPPVVSPPEALVSTSGRLLSALPAFLALSAAAAAAAWALWH